MSTLAVITLVLLGVLVLAGLGFLSVAIVEEMRAEGRVREIERLGGES